MTAADGARRALRLGVHYRARKARLRELAETHGVRLPAMPPGKLDPIFDAEQALVDAGVDPGEWNPEPTIDAAADQARRADVVAVPRSPRARVTP